MRLRHARGDQADAVRGDELDRHVGLGVDLLQIEDELREILDRVDVVVRGRRDERDARLRPAQAGDLLGHLVGGDLAALARLGALRDLDLELLRERRVLGRDAEAPRGDLLDLRVPLVAIPAAGLAALPGVGAAAEAVERDRDRLVRLGRERAVRHRAAGEAPHDRVDGLDLVERDGVTDRDGLEQVAGLEGRPLVHERGEPLVEVEALALHRLDEGVRGRHALLQRVDDVRVGRVGLAALAELVEAGVLERDLLRLARGEPLERLALQPVEADPADRGRRRAEEAAAEPTVEPDRLEEARPAIARDVGDPELRHHLQHPVLERPEQATLRLVRRGAVAADLVRRRELRDGLEREPRADHVGAVADERRDHVRVAGLVARHDERAVRAPAALGEAHVGGRHGEERRDRGPLAARAAVAEADDRRATRDELDARVRDALDGASEPLLGRERRVHRSRFERLQPVGRDEERREDDERRQADPPPRAAGGRRRASRPTSRCARGSGRSPGS